MTPMPRALSHGCTGSLIICRLRRLIYPKISAKPTTCTVSALRSKVYGPDGIPHASFRSLMVCRGQRFWARSSRLQWSNAAEGSKAYVHHYHFTLYVFTAHEMAYFVAFHMHCQLKSIQEQSNETRSHSCDGRSHLSQGNSYRSLRAKEVTKHCIIITSTTKIT